MRLPRSVARAGDGVELSILGSASLNKASGTFRRKDTR